MPLVWSDTQVKAGIVRTVIETFEDKHLPWCDSLSEDCSCFGKKRKEMLTTFANAVAEQDKSANEMYMRIIYAI